MDLYLFAGDSEDFPNALYPFDSVKGNCDYYNYDEKRFIRLPYGNLLMKHHPSLTKEESNDIKIFVHGHTHVPKISKKDGIITICPGSLSYSRNAEGESFAILECSNDSIEIKILSFETKMVLLKINNKLK